MELTNSSKSASLKARVLDKLNKRANFTGHERKYLYNILESFSSEGSNGKSLKAKRKKFVKRLDFASDDSSPSISENEKKMIHVKLQTDNVEKMLITKDIEEPDMVNNETQTIIQEERKIFVNAEVQVENGGATKMDMANYLIEAYKQPKEKRCQEMIVSYSRFLFPERRAFILSNSPPTANCVKEHYPYLFNMIQVVLEFELVTRKDNLFKTFKTNVGKFSWGVMTFSPVSSYEKNSIPHATDEESKLWIQNVSSLIFLPRYFGEDRRNLIIFENESPSQDHLSRPYIKHNGPISSSYKKDTLFDVFIDDIVLCTTSNIIEAYFCLMAAYFIFDIMYSNSALKTLLCLERLYLEYPKSPNTLKETEMELLKLLEKYGQKNPNKCI